MDLGEIAQDLYAVSPNEFIAARQESVAAARAAGEDELARTIGALRKPNAAAAAVNLLARHREDLLDEVVELGEELREAQDQGNGALLRELNERRKGLLKRIAAETIELTEEYDLSHSAAIINDVDGTIKAALANPDAARVVRAGLLVAPLSGAGLGFVDLADSVALPDFELKPREPRPKERRLKAVPDLPDAKSARRDAARGALGEAAELAEQAAANLEQSEQARSANETKRAQLHHRLDELQRELREVQADAEESDADARGLDRAAVQAARDLATAGKGLTRAKERLDRLD